MSPDLHTTLALLVLFAAILGVVASFAVGAVGLAFAAVRLAAPERLPRPPRVPGDLFSYVGPERLLVDALRAAQPERVRVTVPGALLRRRRLPPGA